MELTYSPIKIPIFHSERSGKPSVVYFNNISQAAGLRIDCRGEGQFRGKDEGGWVKVVR